MLFFGEFDRREWKVRTCGRGTEEGTKAQHGTTEARFGGSLVFECAKREDDVFQNRAAGEGEESLLQASHEHSSMFLSSDMCTVVTVIA